MAKRKNTPAETIYRLMVLIFFLVAADLLFMHPVGDVLACGLLLLFFFYLGKPSER